jgi:hypothetical protein
MASASRLGPTTGSKKDHHIMADIYEQHRAAFASVSAYVILDKGERIATIAIKFPRDGVSRLYAYVHWTGERMVRGSATGGGYDKRSAACADAASKMPDLENGEYTDGTPYYTSKQMERFEAFRAALREDGGYEWNRNLEKAGFTVLQAV